MANPTLAPKPAEQVRILDRGIAPTNALALSLLGLQRVQLAAMLAWPAICVALGEESWRQWQCRFGGGMPIDG